MAIANELSSDIAAAILSTRNRDYRELTHLKEIVFEVHSTLQRLTADLRKNRASSQDDVEKHIGEN